MKTETALVLLVSALLSSGCAVRLTAVPVSPKAKMEMGATRGIPYYVPRPYLLVTRDLVLSDSDLAGLGLVSAGDEEGASVPMPAPSATASGGSEDEGGVKLAPTYTFQVVYLPDLSRQYALQQRGGGLHNITLKYELEGGWMFKGTELSSETRVPDTITATMSGISEILGSSAERIVSSLFPIPDMDAGISGVGPESRADIGPKIWLFEISEGKMGKLYIDMERPFFEWPGESRVAPVYRPPVEAGHGPDPDFGDLEPAGDSDSGVGGDGGENPEGPPTDTSAATPAEQPSSGEAPDKDLSDDAVPPGPQP